MAFLIIFGQNKTTSPMSIFYFFGVYLLLMLVVAFFVLGWYAITRGQVIKFPDGTEKKAGKIFKAWYFFWMKQRSEPIKKYYTGFDLLLLASNVLSANGLSVKAIGNSHVQVEYNKTEEEIALIQARIKNGFDAETEVVLLENEVLIVGSFVPMIKEKAGYSIRFYKEYEDYVFPDWVRDMTAGCITCHASIYGSIGFWTFHCLVKAQYLHEYVYGWVPHNFVVPAMIMTWGAFCFSLSYVMTVLWKKF